MARLYWLAMSEGIADSGNYSTAAAMCAATLLNIAVNMGNRPLIFLACLGLYGFLAIGLGGVAEKETSRLLTAASILFSACISQ